MRSTTFYIHTCLPNNSISLSLLHKLQTLINISNFYLIKPLYIYPIIFILMNEHFLIHLTFIIFEQIHHILIIEL
jgi:hypothetical protein